jgi:transglutaminase-like putative cysteine protease
VLYDIIHRTTYSYASDVSISHHLARLEPRDSPGQRRVSHALEIEPAPSCISRRDDYFGNPSVFFNLTVSHRMLTVIARSCVELEPRLPPPPLDTAPWETVASLGREPGSESAAAREMIFPTALIPRHPALAGYASASFLPGRPALDAVLDLTRRIHEEFVFDPKATTVATPLEHVIKNRRGVCQDFAHFEIGCLRGLGLPARYVSGYIETLPPSGQERLAGADASHAWVQVFIPGNGWIGVDPTTNLLVGERHVSVAWGRDFNDVSPLRGVIVGGGRHVLNVGVDMVRS